MPKEITGKEYAFATSPVVLYYAKGLFVPSAMTGVVGSKPRFSAWFILEQNDPNLPALRSLLKEVGALKLPAPVKFAKMPLFKEEQDNPELRYTQNPGRNHPIWSGDRIIEDRSRRGKETANVDHLAGKLVIVAHSGEDYPPRLGGVVNGVARDFDQGAREANRNLFYNGAKVYPRFWFSVYDAFGGGVSCRVNSVFSLGTGDRLAGGEGSGSAIPEGFKPHSGQSTPVDPFAEEGDDTAPF